MNEKTALARMVSPGMRRRGRYRDGILQIHITRTCNLHCNFCTQASNFGGKPALMTPQQFELACQSLQGYFGVVACFGGNPCTSPYFEDCCRIMQKYFPKEQRGLWANHPMGKGKICRETFNPAFSNINCHMDQEALAQWRRDWPECRPFGMDADSRHSPVFVSMKDLNIPEDKRWELISNCDINQGWSAIVGVFRGQLRGFFCEIAYAMSALHQDEPDYPDTGISIPVVAGESPWWNRPMTAYAHQVRKHCHECGVPLKGYGALALDTNACNQVSATHANIAKPKHKEHKVEIITTSEQLGSRLKTFLDYIGNGKRPKQEVTVK